MKMIEMGKNVTCSTQVPLKVFAYAATFKSHDQMCPSSRLAGHRTMADSIITYTTPYHLGILVSYEVVQQARYWRRAEWSWLRWMLTWTVA